MPEWLTDERLEPTTVKGKVWEVSLERRGKYSAQYRIHIENSTDEISYFLNTMPPAIDFYLNLQELKTIPAAVRGQLIDYARTLPDKLEERHPAKKEAATKPEEETPQLRVKGTIHVHIGSLSDTPRRGLSEQKEKRHRPSLMERSHAERERKENRRPTLMERSRAERERKENRRPTLMERSHQKPGRSR